MPICAYGCGKDFVPLRRGAQTAKGHKACYDSARLAKSSAARTANTPQPEPVVAPQICAYGCGLPHVPQKRGAHTARGHYACFQKLKQQQASERRAQLDALTEPPNGFASSENAPRRERIEHPKGWEQHVEESGNTATAISQPTENASPDEEELIRGWKLDPKLWRIVGPVNCRRWQSVIAIRDDKGKVLDAKTVWLYYYKANLERIDPVRESHFAELVAEIQNHAPTIKPNLTVGDDAFVVCIADSQMGKSDGDGAAGTVSRFLASIDGVARRIQELRAIGRPLGALYLFGMGDLIENCDGHYDQQTFRTELDLTEQINVMRRLILKALARWAPLFSRVVVGCIGGNHGENRRNGKSFTTFADNHDVAIFHQLSDILSMNPDAYGHVSFAIPKDDLSLTFDIAGKVVAITHGHIIKNSRATASKRSPEASQVAKRVLDWWAQMAHSQHPVGDAEILITGHYHHLLVSAPGAKTHIQCPALEGGSDWYRNQTGQASSPGLLTLRVGKNVSASGWADMEIV